MSAVAVAVIVNGEMRSVPRDHTLGEVVDALGHGRRGVAVALNEQVIPASRWDHTVLSEQDRIEVLTVAQGG